MRFSGPACEAGKSTWGPSDGQAYFISASNENYDLNLYRLTSDYLKISALAAVLFPGGHREAPALWKRNGVYGQAGEARVGFAPIAAATRPHGGGILQLKPQDQKPC